ncbi:MAG TPA: sigma 54-interacting transcriptional regulator [Pyrinomonadaceae bacterium]|jgi:Nif-specific regulatory protein
MNPKFVIIAGDLKGTIFAASDGLSIGREPSNEICLNDLSVSRRHCVVKEVEGQFRILDLDSFNGTFLNSIPVRDQQLEHGDQILVGETLLLFLMHESDSGIPHGTVRLEEASLSARSTVQLRREDALYLRPEGILSASSLSIRAAHDLNALLKISREIASLRYPGVIQERLLESLLETFPAERGAIVLMSDDLGEPISAFGRDIGEATASPVRISWTVARQVLSEGASVMSNDVLDDSTYEGAQSLAASLVNSLLCVPLTSGERVCGFIYLDTSDRVKRFDEQHLQLLTAIGAIASLALENARHVEWLEGENRRLRDEIDIEHDMVGESPRMRQVYELIARAAPSDSTVLIRGQSGTGKELAAHAIHRNSPRASKPFVAINCAALNEGLLESELFGHERGAFTGAVAQKKGKLEVADGGTLFLDEIGELASTLQAKLLRVLQTKEFERVGGTRRIHVDVRFIAATNRDLKQAVANGLFRQDLYYRLDVISFEMPALKDRKEDIALLSNYFTVKFSRRCKRRILGISPEARSCLLSYDWPGNVRELENAIERAAVLGTTELIVPEDLPDNIVEAVHPEGQSLKYYEAVGEAKKQIISRAIEQANGNYTEAARLLGVHPNNLHRLLRTLNLKDSLRK